MLSFPKSQIPLEWESEERPHDWRKLRTELKHSPSSALPKLLDRAESGSPLCMMELGRAYALGIGVSPNAEEAEKWLKKVSDTGSVRAHHNLGRLYMRQKKYDNAYTAYSFGAARGYAPAIHDLGKLYFLGLGVPKDWMRAEQFLRKASAMGSVFATRLLARLLMESGSTVRRRGEGYWLRIRVYFDFLRVLFTEGLDSEKLLR